MPIQIQLSLFGDNTGPAMQVRPRPSVDEWMQNLIDGPPVPESGGFAVIEDRERVIWGIGETGREALDDAVQWLTTYSGKGSEKYDIEDRDDVLCAGLFTVRPCSAKVMREVNRYGGDIVFTIHKGRVVLPKETLKERICR